MAAEDNLAPRQFYHGSDHQFQPGDEVKPSDMVPGGARNPLAETLGHTHFAWSSPTLGGAMAYGRHVYEVEHTGLNNPFTWKGKEKGHVSLAPMKVTREVTPEEKHAEFDKPFGSVND